MARIHGIPAVEFGDGAKMDKPVHLNCFVESARGVSRNPATDFGNLFELSFTLRILLLCRKFFCKVGMAFGKDDDCIT